MNGEMTAPNPSTGLAVTIIDELRRGGVTAVVISPGSRSGALAMAAADAFEVIVQPDERSAAFFALGIGQTTGIPAAVITTSGTAVANLMPAVVEANLAEVPLLVLTADRPPLFRQVGANQTIDQSGIFGGQVRWFCEVGVPEDRPDSNAFWRSTVCRALAESSGHSGSAGPVHLNLAFHEPTVPAVDDGRDSARPFVSSLVGRPEGRKWLDVIAPPIGEVDLPQHLASPKGIVIAGRTRWGDAARWLAQDLGWPLVAEPISNARGPGAITAAHHLAARSDLQPEVVIQFGGALLSRPVTQLVLRAERVVTVSPGGWIDPNRNADSTIRGLPRWRGNPVGESGWLRSWSEADMEMREAINRILDQDGAITEPRVARDVARAASGGRLIVGSSMPVRDLDVYMEPVDCRVFSNRGASGIDGFVSTALGVASTEGAVPVALCGDLTLLHDSNGFLVTPRPDCVFVTINNNGGGIFSLLPPADFPEHFERVFGTPHGRDLRLLANFHGLDHQLVTEAAQLTGVVEAALVAGGVHLVEVQTERATNVAFHRSLTARLASLGAG